MYSGDKADCLRGPELEAQKQPDVFGVHLVGASVAPGWGVPWEETVGAVLGPLLSAKRGAPVEVVLAAAASWNTVFEVRDVYVRFSRFDPDMIVLVFVSVFVGVRLFVVFVGLVVFGHLDGAVVVELALAVTARRLVHLLEPARHQLACHHRRDVATRTLASWFSHTHLRRRRSQMPRHRSDAQSHA